MTRVCAARPLTTGRPSGLAKVTLVGAVGAVDDDGVGRAVAAAADRVEVDVDRLDVGAGEVVDGDRVGAAERADVDVLDRRRGPS